ncbi:hypothetical protein D6779_02455, partial [Candidatus Parcubacteria bacterium]
AKNNPVKFVDPSGLWWDYLADGVGLGYDIYVIKTEGASFKNVATFLVDVVLAAAPFIPSIGGLKALGKAASHGDEVVKGAEAIASRGGAGFIIRESGEILDVSKIRIPGPRNSPFGKVDYLLGRVPSVKSKGKGGFFKGVLGFGDDLAPALNRHLVENFSQATVQGNRIRVVGNLRGPNGKIATVQSVWQITTDGFVDLITAFPK